MKEILHSQIFGEGEPLLILHGFLGMSDNWKTLGNQFAKKYEVHLIDQRNHGRSFHADDMSYELMGEDLVRYLDAHNLKSVNLLGHSMGGKVAMLFAVNYPEKVHRLIVADIGVKYYPPHHEDILRGLAAVDFTKHTSRKAVEAVLMQYIPEQGVRQFLLKNVYRPTKDQLAFRFNLASLTANYEEVGVALPTMTRFEGATLFLRGANSGYIADEDWTEILTHFPKAILKTVKNAGHWLHAENPTEFYNDVVMFLDN
ncbi:alpha/beta fold hydrolase [Flavobacteriaceae bacterium F08102]|nr:alpha/beta fold hydrolase [Flavobacteriaceae bacterium F08102]